MRDAELIVAVQVPLGVTVTEYPVIAAPPFVSGSCQETVAVVLGSAVTWALRGAEAVVVASVTVAPPEARGVNSGLAELARPAPALFTARRLTW